MSKTNKTFWYTVASDDQHLKEEVPKFMKSFKKFHPNIDLNVITLNDLRAMSPSPYYDYSFKLTPLTLMNVMKDYDCAVRLDSDQIVLGNLEHVIDGDFDVAVVQNSNPRDWKNHYELTGQRLTLYDIDPLDYVNCGFVVVKSKRFVSHWWELINRGFFQNYQFREQDMLNLLTYYFPYKVKYLDRVGNKWHGLISKLYTPHMILRDGKVILPPTEWNKEEKEIVCYHYAGGGGATKGKYKLLFNDEVADYIEKFTI
mgnify:CR=1 FL=1